MRKLDFALVLLLKMMLLTTTLELEMLYSVPEGWRIFANDSLLELQGDGRSGSYRPVSAHREGSSSRQDLLLSKDEDFGLAFLNFNGTRRYYLALMLGTRNSSTAAPVWIANRNNPVSENSVLARAEGRLQLLDADGTVAWSPTNNSVAYIAIEDSGNLKFLNESRSIIWTSFDHPANALLPNQALVTGQKVVSNKDASDPREGSFVAEVQSSGAVSYLSIPSKEKQPYFLWGFVGSKLSSTVANCPGYQTVVRFTPDGKLRMVYEPTVSAIVGVQPCGSPLQVDVFPGNTTLRYFQIEDDGSIASYRRELANGSWQQDSISQLVYLPPAKCGSYGLFDQNGEQCRCLSDETSNSTTTSPGRCTRPLENCSTRYETDFVTIAGASYFTNRFVVPDRTGAPIEDCLRECKSTCSCAAFFFDQALQNCFLVNDVLGSITLDSSKTQQLLGFLKFQNRSKLVPVHKSSSQTPKLIAIGVTSGSAAVAAATFALIFVILRRRHVMLKELDRFLTGVEASPYRFSYPSLHSATGGFAKVLGTGGCGAVYEGTLHNGMKLAVKKLDTEHAQKHFVTEVSALGSISHINIVKLYGFCADASHRLLVYEFMPNGSLDEWIFGSNTRREKLDWKLRYSIALDTARGLAYLHDKSKDSIIHLDIKPQNILLGDKFEAKVGDFGMAKLLMGRDRDRGNLSGAITAVRGTPGYLAPELLMHAIATKKCDVYSYGMVLLELIGGRKNLDCSKLDSPLSWYFPAWAMAELHKGNTVQVLDPSIRDEADTAQARNLIHAAFWCTQEDPGARPTMDAVVRMLESDEEIETPPLTFQFDVQAPGILSIASSGDVAAFFYHEEGRSLA